MSLQLILILIPFISFPTILLYFTSRLHAREMADLYSTSLAKLPDAQVLIEKVGEAVAKTVGTWTSPDAPPPFPPPFSPDPTTESLDDSLNDGHIYEQEVNRMMAQIDQGMGWQDPTPTPPSSP